MKEVKREFARGLRRGQTRAEKLVWELIRNRKCRGLKVGRQHVIEGFVLDFYCHEIRLGIEIDGSFHRKRGDYDRLRQEVIESEGVTVIRVTNKEIANKKRSILDKIDQITAPVPLPLGEGCLTETGG